MKQFKTKKAFDKWIMDNFYKEPSDFWDIDSRINETEVAKKLQSAGYNLSNLTANGEGYEIDGHTNNGWIWEDDATAESIDILRAEGRLLQRASLRDNRIAAGLSRAEMARQFEIPIRTLENWEAGTRKPPLWAEKLIIEKLKNIAEDSGQY